ncbi:MAG: helix-turn-helix transcriptional regulator [Pseudomonadales bacterium]|jgi:DNA-binding PadR family transcriptional regulator|nr:helix-turn-helix transcriptional regulator [Pseudomonadales bacterium]MDP7359202.1 helix-turn-helix transcriptional regulator [Pseudomonadales bacterium]MDP7596150.1 helix-turn-helix transcriptional regulator [Pseudomonadales bacterium]HJN50198.1 helix-turn-helix transcriptional regulator [Pseudomonadales bacterium]|tara:strand:+ start:157 stop:498 length:342 start_codon:yes stop_codon:yes gene_type:complete
MALAKGLVAASATPLILSILSHRDSYGYAIIEEVRKLSDGELQWADGMLYPILHRLEDRQQIESYWGASENGRKRKYYRLRKSGLKELDEQRNNWNKLHAMLMNLKGGKACFN